MSKNKIIAIVGSYRKGGVVDRIVSEILVSASQSGAEVKKIYLIDKHIEFCTNCRECMQNPGIERGKCVLNDDMESLLQEIELAHSIVIGAPVNFGNITAITRMFMERCVGYAYWPWEFTKPEIRNPIKAKKAILVSSSGAPAQMRSAYKSSMDALKYLAGLLGTRPIGRIWVHRVNKENMDIPRMTLKKAARLGKDLATF